jgi:hypothetical protein
MGMEDDDEFAIKLPGSPPVTNENYFDHEDQKCGHHTMAKALKALGNVNPDGLKVVGDTAPTMTDFIKMFRVDIDAFKKSDDELASFFGAESEKENKDSLLQGVYDALKKDITFGSFRQFAIDLSYTTPDIESWANPTNLKNAHGAAVIVLGELYKMFSANNPFRLKKLPGYVTCLKNGREIRMAILTDSTVDFHTMSRKCAADGVRCSISHHMSTVGEVIFRLDVDRRRFRGCSRISRSSPLPRRSRVSVLDRNSKKSSSSFSKRLNDRISTNSTERKVSSSSNMVLSSSDMVVRSNGNSLKEQQAEVFCWCCFVFVFVVVLLLLCCRVEEVAHMVQRYSETIPPSLLGVLGYEL